MKNHRWSEINKTLLTLKNQKMEPYDEYLSSVFQISNRYKLMKSDIYAPRNREKGQAERKILITTAIISIVTLSCKSNFTTHSGF